MVGLITTRRTRSMRRAEPVGGPMLEFLAFQLAGEMYGVPLRKVREILSPPPITEVPRASSHVVGVCSVRGLLVTVFDLRRRLGIEERPLTRRARILLMITDHGEIVGLLVDEVRHVIRLSESEIELATSALGADVSEQVVGIGRPPGQEIVLLELSGVFGGDPPRNTSR